MSTWKCKNEIEWTLDTGLDYATCVNTWEYQTTSDYLTITTKEGESRAMAGIVEPGVKVEHYSNNEARALLETLIDWLETYDGQGSVQELLNKRSAK